MTQANIPVVRLRLCPSRPASWCAIRPSTCCGPAAVRRCCILHGAGARRALARLPAEAGRALRRDRADPSRPRRRAGGRVDRAHLRPGVPLSRSAGHARPAARASGRRVPRRLDRRRDGDVRLAPAGVAGADRSGGHQGRGLDLSVPVRHGADGRGRHDLPQSGGGAGAGAGGHECRHDRGDVPPEHGRWRGWPGIPYLYDPLLRRRLARITAPTLLAWGAHDRLAPLVCAEAWRREIPGATLRVFDDSGHVPHIEEPDAVAAAVVEFCASREATR